ncbi:MAG: hypothetical protein AAF801_00030 [Pseudomonadota bacterium]
MSDVRRFTTRYDPAEDRIKLLVELNTDEVRVLLLTRRLLNRLLPPLLNRLNQAPVVQEALKPQAQAAQHFAQSAAIGEMTKQKGVEAASAAPDRPVRVHLVSSVDVHSGANTGLALGFKSGETVVQLVPFTEPALRQWLHVVYRQYKAGDWREGFWPSWVAPSAEAAADLRLN